MCQAHFPARGTCFGVKVIRMVSPEGPGPSTRSFRARSCKWCTTNGLASFIVALNCRILSPLLNPLPQRFPGESLPGWFHESVRRLQNRTPWEDIQRRQACLVKPAERVMLMNVIAAIPKAVQALVIGSTAMVDSGAVCKQRQLPSRLPRDGRGSAARRRAQAI
jgi:hypothetical protein